VTPEGMIRTGAVGAAGTALCGAVPVVLALCCAPPAATLALGAAGAGLAGAAVRFEWLWLWLLAAPLLGFLALLAYGLHRQGRVAAAEACRGPERGGGTAALPNAG